MRHAQRRSFKITTKAYQNQAVPRLCDSRLGPREQQLASSISSKGPRNAEVHLLLFAAVNAEAALITDNRKLGISTLVGQSKPRLHIFRNRQNLKDAMPVRVDADGHCYEGAMVN